MSEKLEIIIMAKDKFSGVFGKLRSSLPSLKTLSLGAAAGVGALGTSMFAIAKSTAGAYDQIQKFSDRIGISTEALSKYNAVAEFSGVSQQTMQMGFQRMTRRISEAAQGTGVAVGALEELGISIDSIAGKRPDEQFELITGAMQGVANQSDKARIAMQFFDTEGVALVQTMKGGVEGLKAMQSEAERFGLVVSAKAGADAAAFNDALARIKMSLTGLKNTMAEKLMPVFTGAFNRLAGLIADNREKIVAFAGKFLMAMGHVAERAVHAVGLMIDSWRGLKMTWQVLKIAFAGFSKILWKGIDAITVKLKNVMEKLNFRGVFDDAIARVNNFSASNKANIDYLVQVGDTAREKLDQIISEGYATSKVQAMTDRIKAVIAEIRAEAAEAAGTTSEGGAGIAPFTEANVQATRNNMAAYKTIIEDMPRGVTGVYPLNDENIARSHANLEAYKMLIEGKKITDAEYSGFKGEQMSAMNQMASNASKAGFKQAKAIAIPATVMATRETAMQSYKALAGIPYIGPALGA
ncbi:MAG: hypothetical protein JRC86_12850, partial [Deltaproteobacteria bacterium]|nr:hypothetical protein [Deltaproteobacteria bacterium]